MRSPSVIHSTSGTPSVSVWTGSILYTNAALVPGKPDITTQSAPTRVIVTRSDSTAASWCLSSQGRRPQWLYTGASARLQPIPAFDSPSQQAAGPEPDTQRPPEPDTQRPPEPDTQRPPEPDTQRPPEPDTQRPPEPDTQRPPEPDTQRPPRLEKIELAIDSLQNYAVKKPIPVVIETLGDRVFIAEAPDLNLSTSGNSVGAALLALKEQIVATYEGQRTRRGQESERARQVSIFDEYIISTERQGRSAGSWGGVWGSR